MAAPLLETPSRVLRRVMEAEDVELPSLPSIVDHFDDTSDDGMYSRDDSELYGQQTPAKPTLPLSRLRELRQPSTPLGDITSSSINNSGPLFPPRSSSSSAPSSPFTTSTAKPSTSTPLTVRETWSHSSQSSAPSTVRHDKRSELHHRSPLQRSVSHSTSRTQEEPTSSTVKTAVYAPGEMSLSFDGMPIADDLDHSGSLSSGSSTSVVEERDRMPEVAITQDNSRDDTSIQHASETPLERRLSNVLLTRPHRRAQSNRYEGISVNDNYGPQHPRTPSTGDRIPSLSRSSDDDSSAAAHTPEHGHQAVFQSTFVGNENSQNRLEVDGEQLDQSMSLSEMATPLPSKLHHRQFTDTSPLQEMSTNMMFDREDAQSTDQVSVEPYTPAHSHAEGATSHLAVLQTPRPGPTEAQWRKNHVLAVLQSTSRPRHRAPSTPFPSTRMAALVGEATPRFSNGSALQTPTQNATNQSFELADGSFISVASSADLTSDRRASSAAHVTSHRGNNSFPNILLPTGLSHSSNAPDHRVDGAKLQKHLNAMNKQLLEENRELAQALEMWQDQAERRRLRLQGLGEDVDDSLELPVLSAGSPSGTKPNDINRSNDYRDALLREMAEKIEALEMVLKSKDDALTESRKQASSLPSKHSLEIQLDACRAQIDELKAEHAARTEEHAAKFENICGEYQSTITALESQISGTLSAQGTSQATASIPEDDKTRLDEEQKASTAMASVAELKSCLAAAEEGLQHWQSLYEALVVKHDNDKAAYMKLQDEVESDLRSARQEVQQKEEEVRHLNNERSRLQSASLAIDERLQVALQEVDRLKVLETEQEHQIQDLEDALDEAERQLAADEIELSRWRQDQAPSLPTSSSSAQDVDDTRDTALQRALDEAHKEVGRLQQCISDDKAAAQADQARLVDLIKSLERERESFCSQLAAKRGPQPINVVTPSGPFHKSLAALRTPGPLREMSWMDSSAGDVGESALRAQVGLLQSELAAANQQLDGNFSRLETAGAGAVELAERLSQAESRVAELEEELLERRGPKDIRSPAIRQLITPSPVANRLAELQVDMKQERERLQRESERLRTTITMMQAEHAKAARTLRSEISSEARAKTRLAKDVESLKRANVELAASNSRQEREIITQQRDSEGKLRAELSKCVQRLALVEKELAIARSPSREHGDHAKLRVQIDKERAQSQMLSRRLAGVEEEVRTKQDTLIKLGRERDRHLQDLAAFDQELGRYRQDAEQLNSDIRHWEIQSASKPRGASGDAMRALSGQIRYLKAKFTREASFRNALCLQKRYLLLLVGGMSLNEQATLAAIASMGFPTPHPAPRKRTLRSVVLACIATIRARKSASAWQTEVFAKHALLAARKAHRPEGN